MTDVIIAPRLEDPLSDVETVINGGYFQVRASRWNSTAGQWVSDAWPNPINLTGSAVTVKLDASTVPYELYVNYPDGRGGFAERTEFRTVTASGTPLKWEDLVLTSGPGADAAPDSGLAARVTALEVALAGVSGGASTLAGISDMSAPARTFNAQTSYANMMSTLTAAPLASPALTGNPTAPTPTAGDNDTSIATTAFVQGELTAGGFSLASPAFTGNPTAPTPTAGDADASIATTAFVDTSFAKKVSPPFTGVPTAPTATLGTNTTQLATTAFVQAAVAAAAANTFYVWVPVAGVFPARPATTQHLAFLSSTVTPTLDGSLSGGGGMVPNHDIWIRALP